MITGLEGGVARMLFSLSLFDIPDAKQKREDFLPKELSASHGSWGKTHSV